jgi:hypothetical protein
MTIAQYQTLTGITVPASQVAYVEAQIRRTQRILEEMLGYTLDETLVDENQYTETGKTSSECPCPQSVGTLLAPDAVVYAYRLFPYNAKDTFLSIDPATVIHKVKLVKDSVTYRTLDADEYRGQVNRGLIKYLEQIECWCSCNCDCDGMQLAVDADWVWADEDDIPEALLDVWADMVTTYSDPKDGIKSETLGSHSYTRFDQEKPEYQSHNLSVIKRFAGPLGSVKRTPTI